VSATSPSSEVQHRVRSLSRAALEAEHVALEAEHVALEAEHVALEAEHVALLEKLAAAQAEREQLSQAYTATKFELALLKKRLFIAKAERVDVAQLEMEFAAKLAELDALSKRMEPLPPELMPEAPSGSGSTPAKKKKPSGRRNLAESELPEERVEVVDESKEGKLPRTGFEISYRMVWRRGGMVRLKVEKVKYADASQPDADGSVRVTVAPTPPTLFPRSMATPSLVAHIAVVKHCDGLPLHRQEQALERDGEALDRGTMSRWLEHAGATLGATILAAAKRHAVATAFGCATDATGISVQPLKGDMKKRQPCRKGHFFVQLFDRQHVFFEYVPRETSTAVTELMAGFKGYVQADAKSVYDVLFRPPSDEEEANCTEVGCWCHARRKFWEGAIADCKVSREALVRISRLFENEEKFKGLEPEAKKQLRNERTRPLVDAFFAWAKPEYEKVKHTRGLLRTALGYAVRQEAALTRFLEDGRLSMENNASERELRRVAVGRKAWLFVGSDDHAQAAANLFSLIASCKLHELDPEGYLRDVMRVLPHWPRERYLELAPLFFATTRAKLDPTQLDRELGPLAVPPPL
jgi:transposase